MKHFFRRNNAENNIISLQFSAGYRSNAIKDESIAFDWLKFWQYLKPHLLKFLAAIAVRKFQIERRF